MLRRSAGYTFIGSFFLLLLIWGYLPRVWLMGWPQLVCVALGFVGLIVWAISNLEVLALWVKKRSTRFGLSMLFTALFTFVIVGAVNYVASLYNVKKDFTKNKLHTLSEQTEKVLHNLQGEVTLRVWTTSLERMATNINARDFFNNYQLQGRGKLKLEVRNPNEDRAEAERDKVSKDNLIIVKAASGREIRIDTFTDTKGEEQVTNALIQAFKGGHKKTICFLTGHGELSLSNSGPEGLSVLKTRLEESSYQTQDLALATADAVPNTCEMLAIVGPSGAPLGAEIAHIQEYMAKGGNVMALMGPSVPQAWQKIFDSFGVKLGTNVIIDPRVRPPVAVATQNFAQDVEIVKSFNRLVVFPEASSISVPKADAKATPGLSIKTFISSESYTYAKEGAVKSLHDIRKTGNDLKGPLAVAVLIRKAVDEKAVPVESTPGAKTPGKKAPTAKKDSAYFSLIAPAYAEDQEPDMEGIGGSSPAEVPNTPADKTSDKKEMTLLLFSNHAFAANSIVSQMGNMDLLLNSVSYLIKDSGSMGIRPRELRQAKLELSQENFRQVVATVLLFAAMFGVGGILAGHRRRSA